MSTATVVFDSTKSEKIKNTATSRGESVLCFVSNDYGNKI